MMPKVTNVENGVEPKHQPHKAKQNPTVCSIIPITKI